MKRFTPSCIMHQNSDVWRRMFTPCDPQKPTTWMFAEGKVGGSEIIYHKTYYISYSVGYVYLKKELAAAIHRIMYRCC